MVATLQPDVRGQPDGIVDYSPAPRRLAWRTARALASAWRRRSNTSGSVTLRRVRMLTAPEGDPSGSALPAGWRHLSKTHEMLKRAAVTRTPWLTLIASTRRCSWAS